MSDLLARRRFLSALAASVVAAGMPLPIGFPQEVKRTVTGGKITFAAMKELWEADYLLALLNSEDKTIFLYPGSHKDITI